MASIAHTYRPSCLLHAESNTFTRRASLVSINPSPIKAQYFYCSALPIDDPLSPVPPPPSGSTAKSPKLPPQPFSIYDNRALEDAWLNLQNQGRLPRSPGRAAPKQFEDSCFEEAKEHGVKSTSESAILAGPLPEASSGHEYIKRDSTARHVDLTLYDDPGHIPFDETMPVEVEELDNDEFEGGINKKRSRSPFRRRRKAEKTRAKDEADKDKVRKDKDNTAMYGRLSESTQKAHDTRIGSSPDTTGTPFLRAPSRKRGLHSRSPDTEPEKFQTDGTQSNLDEMSDFVRSRPDVQQRRHSQSESEDDLDSQKYSDGQPSRHKQKPPDAHVPVGVSRLHVVEMPSLKMGPIYWDPVHDISSVVRGTWFYKETLWPVETELANRIEEGYDYIKPWTPSYVDELNSCQEIGPEAELKVAHKIWPAEEPPQDSSRPATRKGKETSQDARTDQLKSDDQIRHFAAVVAGNPENRAAGVLDGFDDPLRLFAKCSIIYADARNAQILQPNQLPSVTRGRKPLAKIRKGIPIGVPVVRGFDHKAWEKVYPPKKPAATTKSSDAFEAARIAAGLDPERPEICAACLKGQERPKATDLVFMVHGIGQKLSERVESFHFTHAINSFRRQVNLELESEAVQPWKREGLGAIMVLPINWRSKMKLEDGGTMSDPNQKESDPIKNHYDLKDITAESLPAVRNLISDVMLDVPYYLSHHKPKMVEAVIKEANRIYRLWCINNPGFHETGRVHLVAHSLGSVMALDILSKQPTKLPKPLDFKTSIVRSDMFEFDTKSLFFCGSPAGFFLLLHHAPLLPRRGRDKPGADGEDLSTGVAGEAGIYGCLAVDNLYNISHEYDPVAYRINACVDADLSASLKRAVVPSVNVTWAQWFGSAFKSKPVGPIKAPASFDTLPARPLAAKMPSTVELETHNFTREEIAEKRMSLMNDNGQIDFILKSNGGPLEIQYLNMLSAHSSYWTRQDFVRFLVVEIGRRPGKDEVLSTLKATKKARK